VRSVPGSPWPAAVALLALAFAACDADDAPPGHVVKDTTWSGTIVLTGDVVVDAGVTLTILPGTRIVVTAGMDDTGQSQLGPADDMTRTDPTGDPEAGGDEYHRTHIAINAQGRIVAKGTAEKPIVFTSSSTTPHYTDWIGITAREGEFEYVVVEWCINGIYSVDGGSRFTLDHVNVRHVWAAATGFQYLAPGALAYVRHSTLEDCGHEAVDTHSPGMLEVAYNVIRGCQAGLNLHDDITLNAHHNVIVDTTFPVLAVNAKNAFVTQHVLNARDQDASRWTYQGWTMPALQGGAAVFVPPGDTHLVVTNSIVFDSARGLRNEAAETAIASGWIAMDDVAEPYVTNAIPGEGGLAAGAGFVDPAAGDFRLRADSPCRNAGNPADGSPDLGAFGGADAQAGIGWQGP